MKPILKYQEGGDISSLFINYQPFTGLNKQATSPQATTATPASQNDGESKSSSKVGLKDLLGLVKELKGLPVDQNIVTQQIQKMYDDASLFSSNGELSTGDLISTYLSALRSIRMAEFNQQEYKDVRDQVVKEGGYNEIAIDTQGKIYIQNQKSGAIDRITPEQYNGIKDKENYQVLTNANLLYYRANNPDFAFNSDIFSIVSNGIGMGKITDYLQKVASKIGTTTLKQEGYSEKSANGIVSGLANLEQAFQAGMTIEGLYKQGKLTKDQTDQAKLALNYLWKTLPDNAKTLLKVKGGSVEGAFNLIQTLVFSGIDNTIELSNGLVKNTDGSDSNDSSGSGDKDKSDKINPYINMLNEEGASYQRFHLNPGTSYSMSITGAVYGNLKDNNWNPIGNSSMANVLDKGLSGIVQNMYGISFGNRVIDPEDLNDIMYDGGGAMVVSLPAKIKNGVKVVDLDIVNKYKEAKELYDKQKGNGPKNPELFAKILQDMGLNELLDTNGLPDKNRFGHFLVVTGYAVDKKHKFYQTNDNKKNEFIEDQQPDDNLIDLLQRSLSTDSNKSNYKIDSKNWYETNNVDSWWNEYDHIYKGNLYIPLTENEVAGHDAGKETVPYYLQHEQQKRYNLLEKRRNASYITGADVLNSIQ